MDIQPAEFLQTMPIIASSCNYRQNSNNARGLIGIHTTHVFAGCLSGKEFGRESVQIDWAARPVKSLQEKSPPVSEPIKSILRHVLHPKKAFLAILKCSFRSLPNRRIRFRLNFRKVLNIMNSRNATS